jgi:hypothetical protein
MAGKLYSLCGWDGWDMWHTGEQWAMHVEKKTTWKAGHIQGVSKLGIQN